MVNFILSILADVLRVSFTAIHKCNNIDNNEYVSSTIYIIITVYILHNEVGINVSLKNYKHSYQYYSKLSNNLDSNGYQNSPRSRERNKGDKE